MTWTPDFFSPHWYFQVENKDGFQLWVPRRWLYLYVTVGLFLFTPTPLTVLMQAEQEPPHAAWRQKSCRTPPPAVRSWRQRSAPYQAQLHLVGARYSSHHVAAAPQKYATIGPDKLLGVGVVCIMRKRCDWIQTFRATQFALIHSSSWGKDVPRPPELEGRACFDPGQEQISSL